MRIIFMGSPEFAVPTLEALHASRHELVAIVTQPDRPSGRRLHLRPPAVKAAAQAFGVLVLQPETTRSAELLQAVKACRPDILVVVAYGEILRRELLQIPPLGAVNLHASLLPKYRGAAPVAWAILNGEKETGCTTMQISEKMDAGDIYLQETCAIEPPDTAGTLTQKLSRLGAPLMTQTLDGIEKKELHARPQDSDAATYASKLKKEDGLIDWSRPSVWISRQTRAFNPWPGTYSSLHGSVIKLWIAHASEESTTEPPGTVLHVTRPAIHVACGEGSVLRILELQPEGRPRLAARDFANGIHLQPGSRFTTPETVS
ncbi:MAG TPA: methionyl-tRNA formyltransferase [Acidobacteriota bacterium]|nr:methionyl-tRNA formyltransferase [Acidobacteriota bacterium]